MIGSLYSRPAWRTVFFHIIALRGCWCLWQLKGWLMSRFWEGALSRSSTAIKSTGTVYRVVHDMCQSFDTFIQVGIICLCDFYHNWASAWDFRRCGLCDQHGLGSAYAYAQSDRSPCVSLGYLWVFGCWLNVILSF